MKFNTEKIESYMKENNISKREFAKRCGVSLGVVDNIFNHNFKILSTNVIKIVLEMGWSLDDLVIWDKEKESRE